MKHLNYFSGMIISFLMIAALNACHKESMSNSSNPGSGNTMEPNKTKSFLISANHWYSIKNGGYVAHFAGFLSPNGLVKNILDVYLSNLGREDLLQIDGFPTKCTGGKIWYRTEGLNLEVFFIPDDGTPLPTQLFIKIYYNS